MFVKFQFPLPLELFNKDLYDHIINDSINSRVFIAQITEKHQPTRIFRSKYFDRESIFQVEYKKPSKFGITAFGGEFKTADIGVIQTTCNNGVYYHHFKPLDDTHVLYTLEINASKASVIEDQPWQTFIGAVGGWTNKAELPEDLKIDVKASVDSRITHVVSQFTNRFAFNLGLDDLKTKPFPEPWTYKSPKILNEEYDLWKNSMVFDISRGLVQVEDYNIRDDKSQHWYEDFKTYLTRTGKATHWVHNELRSYTVSQLENILIGDDVANPNSVFAGEPTILQQLVNEMTSAKTRAELKTVLDKMLSEINPDHKVK